ncbi:SDR family oxidoreductase [Planococcus shenhongbingii]|uniref:SDR family oxidoreductase n=1 Tax=Planococcus shenhongbingii TaxID=3058398 RepID=A0ABT8NEY9_9BACL|nr:MULTISPECIES: SDR family oxidoreductase [unclassified Planococcus (in: firmicutes)]MDN7246450.1 SDR family oxidoreductase [Planococcus sp. N017]WKA59441.1 SDR family oxidoreductase [Planococcus sp. N016]
MSIFSNEALKHKHVLITGATGGIGYETAKVLAGMGARLTITGRNEEKLNELKQQLIPVVGEENVFVKTADLTVEKEREELVLSADKALGFINGLVNSAGIGGGGVVEELDEATVERVMNVNFKSTLFLTQLVYSRMLEKKEGDIVNLSSLSGLRGTHGNTAYAASKFAVIGWTQSMALEAIEHKIRVNAVCPGYVDTEMAWNSIRKKAEKKGVSFEEGMNEAAAAIPSGRISTTEEVANMIAFLLTDAARNIVGEAMKISGGNFMR